SNRTASSSIRLEAALMFLPGQRLLAQLAERDPRGQRLGIGLHVDDGGLAGRYRALERRREVGCLLDRLAVAAESASVGGEVWILEIGSMYACRVLPLLMHADRSIHAVVDHHDHHVRAVLHRRRELLAVHEEAAVAGE